MSTYETDQVFDDVEHSFELLRRDCPAHYATIADRLDRWPVLLTVDGRSRWFRGNLDARTDTFQVQTRGAPVHNDRAVYVTTTTDCIRRVATGRSSMSDEVLDNASELRVRGEVDGVVATFDSVASYVDAALRCPELEGLLQAFIGRAET